MSAQSDGRLDAGRGMTTPSLDEIVHEAPLGGGKLFALAEDGVGHYLPLRSGADETEGVQASLDLWRHPDAELGIVSNLLAFADAGRRSSGAAVRAFRQGHQALFGTMRCDVTSTSAEDVPRLDICIPKSVRQCANLIEVPAHFISAVASPHSCELSARPARRQDVSPFLFTLTTTPEPSGGSADHQTDVAVAEPGLTWIGGVFDPGVTAGVRTRSGRMVRSSMGTVDYVSAGQRFASFQQVEVLRPIGRGGARDLAVGGGVREEWGGTRVFIGRLVAGVPVAGGRLEGNAVIERATAPDGIRWT
jgi:hypothetical protein